MAAGTLAAPATEYGPCEGSCSHTDCAATRRMASTDCRLCGKPIGYETRFYDETPAGPWPPPAERELVHAACLEESLEG